MGCHTHDYQEAALGHEDLPINMVILVVMLFATEYEYMAYTGLTIGIEQDFGHQTTCFPCW